MITTTDYKAHRRASGRTAMHRTKMSAPVARILAELSGPILDYGCGHGEDVRQLRKRGLAAYGWDPVHAPDMPIKRGHAKTVLCTYVLNTLPTREERQFCLQGIYQALRPGGLAFITVRRDVATGWTRGGTWQSGDVDVVGECPREIPENHVASVFRCPGFETYQIWKPYS